MSQSEPEKTVAEILNDAMKAKGYTSVRGLARALAGSNGDIEKERRALYRYLRGGVIPAPSKAVPLSELLDIPVALITRPVAERAAGGRMADLERRVAALEADERRDGRRASPRPPAVARTPRARTPR